MSNSVLNTIKENKGEKKSIALLIDPDKVDNSNLDHIIITALELKIDYFFIGGSLVHTDKWDTLLERLKLSKIPLILFPGDQSHIHPAADAILFLSLISGRNPEYLIGQQVKSAPILKKSNLEILSTSYILIDGGKPTTVSYISNTAPIPYDKPDIAAATAMAGEMLGHSLCYLDTGSGALQSVSDDTVAAVKESIGSPLIVGGGIKTANQATSAFEAGADILVIGTAFEKDPMLLRDICMARNLQNA